MLLLAPVLIVLVSLKVEMCEVRPDCDVEAAVDAVDSVVTIGRDESKEREANRKRNSWNLAKAGKCRQKQTHMTANNQF